MCYEQYSIFRANIYFVYDKYNFFHENIAFLRIDPGFSLTVAKAMTIQNGGGLRPPPQRGGGGLRPPPPLGGSILCIAVAFATVRENPGSILKHVIFLLQICCVFHDISFYGKCYICMRNAIILITILYFHEAFFH